MIQGGWEFVIAAYTLVWVVLGAYSLTLPLRNRKCERQERESA